MSMPVPLSVASDLESVRSLLLSLEMRSELVVAVLKAQAEIAAAHPQLFAHLRLRGIHVESACKMSEHQLSGGGHQLARVLQMGDDDVISRVFELAARSSLQQRSELSVKVANKRPRKGQILTKEGVFTMFQSSLAASLAVITVAANADKITQKPLMRLVERQGYPIAAQLPCGPDEDKTVNFLYAAADADMSQLKIKQPVPVCTHGETEKHAKGEGKNHHACDFIDAYKMVDKGFTCDAYGAWSQTLNIGFVQRVLVASNGAAAASAAAASAAVAAGEESDAEGESDDEDDSEVVQPVDDERVSASASGPSAKKRAREDKGSSAAASAISDTSSKRRRHDNCGQTQKAPQSAAASRPFRVVIKPAPIALLAELQPRAPSAAAAAAAAAAAPPSNLLPSPSPSVARALHQRLDGGLVQSLPQWPLQSCPIGQSQSESQSSWPATAPIGTPLPPDSIFQQDTSSAAVQLDSPTGFFSTDRANFADEPNDEGTPAAADSLSFDDVSLRYGGVATMGLGLAFGAEPRVFGQLLQHFGADV